MPAIVALPDAARPLQAEFGRLTDALAAQRTQLAHWQRAASAFHQQLAQATAPQRARLRAIDRELLQFLDHAADHAGLGRSDLRLLQSLARDLAAQLLQNGEEAELRALYQRYQDAEPERETEREHGPEHSDQAKPDPPPEVSPGSAADGDDWMAAWERMEAAQHDAATERQRQREHRKSEASEARRQRRLAAPAPEEGSQTLRAVYRKLASALHPDREVDADARLRKTALMQRVNRAYEARSLIDLLQLQLEIAQIGRQAVAAMGDDALRRYNAVLAEQLDALQQETLDAEQALRRALKLGHGAEPTPARIARAIREQARALQQDIAYYEWERQELEDARVFKQWLREQG